MTTNNAKAATDQLFATIDNIVKLARETEDTLAAAQKALAESREKEALLLRENERLRTLTKACMTPRILEDGAVAAGFNGLVYRWLYCVLEGMNDCDGLLPGIRVPNFVTMTFDAPPDGYAMEVTVRRADGKTPHAFLSAFEKQAEELGAILRRKPVQLVLKLLGVQAKVEALLKSPRRGLEAPNE